MRVLLLMSKSILSNVFRYIAPHMCATLHGCVCECVRVRALAMLRGQNDAAPMWRVRLTLTWLLVCLLNVTSNILCALHLSHRPRPAAPPSTPSLSPHYTTHSLQSPQHSRPHRLGERVAIFSVRFDLCYCTFCVRCQLHLPALDARRRWRCR